MAEPISDQDLKAIAQSEVRSAMGELIGDLANERAEAMDYYYCGHRDSKAQSLVTFVLPENPLETSGRHFPALGLGAVFPETTFRLVSTSLRYGALGLAWGGVVRAISAFRIPQSFFGHTFQYLPLFGYSR